MQAVKEVVGQLPVVGQATEALSAAKRGHRMVAALHLAGATLEFCVLASQLGPAAKVAEVAKFLGQARLGAAAAAPAAQGAAQAMSKRRVLASAARLAGRSAAGAKSVIMTRVKKKMHGQAKQAAGKVAAVAVVALAETRTVRKMRRHLSRALPGVAAAAPRPPSFDDVASSDAKLHAALAMAVYEKPEERHGIAFCEAGNCLPLRLENARWYAYVGGDLRRGFWYCPGPVRSHLVMAERGTSVDDYEDLGRDALLGFGLGLTAVQDRVQASHAALREQMRCHSSDRVTVCGHSLGGAVALEVACCFQPVEPASMGVSVQTVHAFNAGGVPDMKRSLQSSMCQAEVHLHRIRGDVISVGFASPWSMRQYSRSERARDACAHALVHFTA
eukprot:TRINITY_DN47479_c0_g3_i1.p1 TRINITY_DN47479_c0_g3~~TRINITY_DN47479_c0_g3_i1.p1  ORF type:complete len:418 (-),score=70.38 TRINITY_DN47479_c0_g3_i1:230-1393(-)